MNAQTGLYQAMKGQEGTYSAQFINMQPWYDFRMTASEVLSRTACFPILYSISLAPLKIGEAKLLLWKLPKKMQNEWLC